MLILAVDTSSPSGSLAVLRDDKVIGSVSARTEELYSSRMFRQLDFLLREISVRIEDSDLLAVAVGPGSFTGLRVGLAAIKGWAEVYHKPVAAVSALEAVAVQTQSNAPLIVPVLDARRGQIYFAIYERSASNGREGLTLSDEEMVMTPSEFLGALRAKSDRNDFSIVTPVPELLSMALSLCETGGIRAGRMEIEKASAILAPHVGRIGALRAEQGRLSDSLALDANYVRRSDAELHWKALAGS